MDAEEIRSLCLSMPHVSEDLPFDESTLVFRVGGKIFALLPLDEPTWINLKCNPEYALVLRERHSGITPGYHMNKKHWNSVSLEGDLEYGLVCDLIRHSYDLIYQSLPKKTKVEHSTDTE